MHGRSEAVWGKRGLVALLTVVVLAMSAGSATAAPASLRLFAATRQVAASQLQLRANAFNLGIWLGSTGGAFQIDLVRPNYGAWSATQIDPSTGATVRALPTSMANPVRGLVKFLSVRFVDARGRVVVRRTFAFCPAGETARVDGSGPQNPNYPFGCNVGFFPFTRGLVWGIDSGWAVQPAYGGIGSFGPGPGPGPGPGFIPPCLISHLRGGIRLKPGRYTVTTSINAVYRSLFDIPAAQASATVQLLVTRSHFAKHPRCAQPTGIVVGSGASSARDAGGPRAAPVVSQPDPATMPNLVALPAWQIHLMRQRHREILTFAATIWNAGPAPFSIEGYRRANSNIMDAFEYFYDSAGNVVGRAPAGTMFFDNARGHHHWHIRQLAAYDLVTPGGQLVRSQKQSFCIAPTNPVDMTVAGATSNPFAFGGLGFGGSACDYGDPAAIWLREQLPVGYGDTYVQFVAGQAFDVGKLPNGTYRIEVRVNPLGVLHETSTTDDLAVRVIRLSGQGKTRKVSVVPWHGITR
jgi:hypothetical protein